MKESSEKVLLIVGPTGSGKSTLAQYISEKLGWQHIEEDDYWAKNGWRNKQRTADQEEIVQQQVSDELRAHHNQGNSVVLDFILYRNPPNSLTAYTGYLDKNSIPYRVIVLKPSAEEILRRVKSRGRPLDTEDLAEVQRNIENQLKCLRSGYIKPEWIVDSSNMTIDELYSKLLN